MATKKFVAKERAALMALMDEPPFRIPRREVDENVILGTWNIRQFNEKKSERALQYIADIIERFDICALQEVKTDLTGLSELQALLPGHYQILVTDPTGNSERFAFIYDNRTVEFTGLACEFGFEMSTKEKHFRVARMPYCASFRAGRFDFVIATVHIFFGSGVKKKLREKEIDLIADHVKKRSKIEGNKVFDRDFFVMGDFNIVRTGDDFFEALVDQGFQMPPEMDQLHTNFKRDKTFDKIAWVPRPGFDFSGNCNVVPFGDVVFQEKNATKGLKEISDHLPLWAEFRVNKLTQELDQIINPK